MEMRTLHSNSTSVDDSGSPSFVVAFAVFSLVWYSAYSLFFSLLGACFFACRRCRAYWQSRVHLKRLHRQRYRPELLHYGTPECSICMSSFVQGEQIKVTMCEHVFHSVCLDQWLQYCSTVPRCPA